MDTFIIVEPNTRIGTDSLDFYTWKSTRRVYTDGFEPHIDKQLLIFHASINNDQARAMFDSNGNVWNGYVHGSWYTGIQRQRIVIQLQESKSSWDPEAVTLAAHKLYSCYSPGYTFPAWSLTNIQKQEKQFRATRVYYGDSTGKTIPNLDDIKRLVRQREPVNMGMHRAYDMDALEHAFGYRRGYYGELAELPPSLSVYTKTSVGSPGSQIMVHILHTIGLAFDHVNQPDFIHFHKLDCGKFYQHFFRLIFACADDRIGTNSIVVLSLVGGNNFARLFPGGPQRFWQQVWIPSLREHLQIHPEHSTRLRGMGFPEPFLVLLAESLPLVSKQLQSTERFPALITGYDRSNTLFINAWDPFSIVGNGNSRDDSLDGFMGRMSNAGILSTTLTNPFLNDPRFYHFVA